MIGDRTGTTYSLGDIVRVRLAEAAPLTRRIAVRFGGSGGKRRAPAVLSLSGTASKRRR